MILERLDLAAIRMAELRGMVPTEGELAQAGLEEVDYRRRIGRLTEGGVVREFRAVPVVPPLLGGDWVWAGVLANALRPLGVSNALIKRLPFASDIIINAGLPDKLGPNLALLFYSRDIETEARFIRTVAGMEHQEVYRIAEYSFPVALPLSSPERELLRSVLKTPAAAAAALAADLSQEPGWVRAKLDRLLWTPANPAGVLRIQPDVDWTQVDNYGHFHFVLETGHRPDQLAAMIADRDFRLVMGGKPYRERYVQVEADVWGVADLMERVSCLNQIAGIRVAGVVWNERVSVNSEWAAGLLA